MTRLPVLIRNILQKDNHTFTIEWSDGLIHDYRLSDLQRYCPCANCNDEITGKHRIDKTSLRIDVRAIRITNVGHYALRVQFTSGCSTGIYSFDMLRELANGTLAKSLT